MHACVRTPTQAHTHTHIHTIDIVILWLKSTNHTGRVGSHPLSTAHNDLWQWVWTDHNSFPFTSKPLHSWTDPTKHWHRTTNCSPLALLGVPLFPSDITAPQQGHGWAQGQPVWVITVTNTGRLVGLETFTPGRYGSGKPERQTIPYRNVTGRSVRPVHQVKMKLPLFDVCCLLSWVTYAEVSMNEFPALNYKQQEGG